MISICKAKQSKNVYKTLRKLSSCYHLLDLLSKTHKKINIFSICLEFQNYDSHSDRCQKKEFIKLGEGIINRQYITIRELAQLIVDVVVTCKAVLTGPLYLQRHGNIKNCKIKEK